MISDELSYTSWYDSDLAQIASIINDISLFRDNKIIANKQNNAISAVEQPANLS